MYEKPPVSSVSEFMDCLCSRPLNFYNPQEIDPPVVSIISSFYNASKYFDETYHSIIHQTWQNFEWIIVDDCSPDPEEVEFFKTLPQRTSKIKIFFREQNGGLAAGRNTGIAEAKGKYLFFMDTDDILDPTYIEKAVLFLETHPDFSFVNSYSVGFQAEEYWWTHGFNKPSKFIEQNWVTGRLLYRKADFDKLGGLDENLRFYEDWERWLKAMSNHQKGWTIPEYLDCYRRTSSGLLASSRDKVDKEKQVTEYIQSRYRPFFEANKLPDIELRRATFDARQFDRKIEVKNLIHPDSTGKRILCWLPHLEVGGADKYNLDLLTLLKERGYEITIVTTNPSASSWHWKFYQITPDIFHLSKLFENGYWLEFARYIMRSRQIDIVWMSNCYYVYYLLPFLRPEFPGVAFVDYTHTDDPGWRQDGYPRVSCRFHQWLDFQVVSSQYLANYYQEVHHTNPEKLVVCYTNRDTDKWQRDLQLRRELRSKLGITEDTVMLLYPARIAPQKRPLFLVEIVRALVAAEQPICVVTMGGGDLLEAMQAKIERLNVGNAFKMLSSVAPEDMPGYYSAADILLLPSAYEGLSLTLYEAMSMELPVVASDVGGNKELVTPDVGFILPKGNADRAEVEEYLKVLVPLIQDAQQRRHIGALARQRVAEVFPLEGMADQMENIFAQAIQKSQAQHHPAMDGEMTEEMLILVQEYLALDEFTSAEWKQLQNWITELEKNKNHWHRAWQESHNWAEHLEKEKVTLETQRQAWVNVARQTQIELEVAQSKLEHAEAELANLKQLQ